MISLADLLTLGRLILVPFILFYFQRGSYSVAFILFLIAGATDLIDGTIARVLKRQTRFGAVLDPIADKVLMGSIFACLWFSQVIPLWFFLLVVGRDVMIMSGLAYLRWKRIVVALNPLWTSKYATLMQLGTAIFGILAFLYPGSGWIWPFSVYLNIFLYAAATLIFISGCLYVRRGIRILKGN